MSDDIKTHRWAICLFEFPPLLLLPLYCPFPCATCLNKRVPILTSFTAKGAKPRHLVRGRLCQPQAFEVKPLQVALSQRR